MTARDAVAAALGRARTAGQRLSLGTGLLLHGAGAWLAPSDSGGKFVARCLGCGCALAFSSQLLERAPRFIAAVPLVWGVAAWRVSDSSATPPPEAVTPGGDVLAVESMEVARVVPIAEGVGCILHPVREEVTDQ